MKTNLKALSVLLLLSCHEEPPPPPPPPVEIPLPPPPDSTPLSVLINTNLDLGLMSPSVPRTSMQVKRMDPDLLVAIGELPFTCIPGPVFDARLEGTQVRLTARLPANAPPVTCPEHNYLVSLTVRSVPPEATMVLLSDTQGREIARIAIP